MGHFYLPRTGSADPIETGTDPDPQYRMEHFTKEQEIPVWSYGKVRNGKRQSNIFYNLNVKIPSCCTLHIPVHTVVLITVQEMLLLNSELDKNLAPTEKISIISYCP